MRFTELVEAIIVDAINLARNLKHEYATPEHLLYILSEVYEFNKSFKSVDGDIDKLRGDLKQYFDDYLEVVETEITELSYSLNEVIAYARIQAQSSERDVIGLAHIYSGLMNLEESYAKYYILSQGVNSTDLLRSLIECENQEFIYNINNISTSHEDENLSDNKEPWREYVTCINDEINNSMPLIGREEELTRTIQILCRKEKNNPIHIGEPGVGKTTIINGLAKLINENKVPDRLKESKIFSVDLGALLAGTQYRGDFENRFKSIMDGVANYNNPIIYIDEIHNIVGAGAIGEGSLDASNLLKPYLTLGKIRFIGATTYEEYNKHFSKNKSLIRRFQNIDIKEPSIEETIEILNGLKPFYEKFHGVKYSKGTIEYAVNLSCKYINDRFLPDKAIDLLDEAGSYRVINPTNKKSQIVDKKLIEEVLSKICNVPKETVESDEVKKLAILEKKLKLQVFGQDKAIEEITNAIKLSRSGLNDDNKPVASLLFVGPTGVGKTEIAKALSKTLNIGLVRFDMSEYVEKHSVAKLIGAPAGYVGYEEGGLLSDAIRKNPHCVLLLDEIEKAHSDIFNILLQVMDYATLTDNKGRKTDFRNVIIVMTSNAGARNVGKTLIGFGEREITRESIEEEVKKLFTPEFRNRLNKVVIFNNLDGKMAIKIVEKKIKELQNKLSSKCIEFIPSKRCIDEIVLRGTSFEYGAREISRIIDSEIKSILVDEILFGKLKKGGVCELDYLDNKFFIK